MSDSPSATLADDPPLGRCPVHPEKNAWRTCGRCGRFLCARCTNPTVDGPRCETCVALIPVSPRQLGGLLLLPLLILLVTPVGAVLEIWRVVTEWGAEAFASASVGVKLWVGLDLVAKVVLAVVASWSLGLFVTRRRAARQWMMIFFATQMLYRLAVLAFHVALSEERVQPLRDILPIGVAALWLLYFRTSRRVRDTFVR